MKNANLFVLSAVFVAACGGSDNRPAEDPSSARTSSETTVTSVTSAAPPPAEPGTIHNDGMSATSTAPATMGTSDMTAPSPSYSAPAPADSRPLTTGVTPAPAPVANASDSSAKPDNTKVNKRDRHDTLTPMDQGNGESERKITAAIRRGVVGDKSLSFTAKNVKIITQGTKVTLRGPVKSDQERAAIEARARQTPGVVDVDNQLEVAK